VRILADDLALQDTLRRDRGCIEPFVEEILRLESPFKGHFRSVRHATTLGEIALDAGDTLFVMWSSANRDATHFAAPDTIDLYRERPRDHLGFGRGIHHCVGAPLARMEARVAIETLLDQTHHFSLDAANPPEYVNSIFVRRHEHLSLNVDPR
jgi:cytochrome P450 family 144